MKSAFINTMSFPGDTAETSIDKLDKLRAGIVLLEKADKGPESVYGTIKFPDLPLDDSYSTLRNRKDLRNSNRDTFLFFLSYLDQKTPHCHGASNEEILSIDTTLIDRVSPDFDEHSAKNILAAHFRGGYILSIGSNPVWESSEIKFSALSTSENDEIDEFDFQLSNIYNCDCVASLSERIDREQSELCLENWEDLSLGSLKSHEFDDWLASLNAETGLTTVVLRSVRNAALKNFRPDGHLVKKLTSYKCPMFEIRATYQGSNNVRLLFARTENGELVFLFAGQKSSPNWYKVNKEHVESLGKEFACHG